MNEALQLYLELSVDIAEMENLGLQKHPRYPIAKKLLSDLSYRLDDLQTEMPDITRVRSATCVGGKREESDTTTK